MPGEYEVEATYGAVSLKRKVSLPPGQKLGVVFTLNVGGIRVLPRLAGIGLPATPSFTTIYAVSGSAAGQLVGVSEMPGEIIRVGSGAYRVESRFSPGNVLAVAEVVVKPGRMSAVEIDHPAGLAHLVVAAGARRRCPGPSPMKRATNCRPLPALSRRCCLEARPLYRARRIGDITLTRNFSIAAGQSHDIVLGE